MLNSIRWILIFCSFYLTYILGSDQVMVHTFESVLHDSGKQWIVELTYEFNEQENIEDARRVTMDSIDRNWKPVMVVPVCAGKNPEPVLMNPLDTVKTGAEKFINYRQALKIFVDELLKKAVTSNVTDPSEIEKVL
ncbi:hypothetical protein CAEBREN_21015 [Caenorhabditis brenneri]|uniref:Uncharacterized protein n=1 Tax=Caenorhabditis brenneri TaxID=135651 RepID=G0NUM3_CAEBE|nr:hypothetical protein CAEBREN_21015 [Caenorhabditis brenneri]